MKKPEKKLVNKSARKPVKKFCCMEAASKHEHDTSRISNSVVSALSGSDASLVVADILEPFTTTLNGRRVRNGWDPSSKGTIIHSGL